MTEEEIERLRRWREQMEARLLQAEVRVQRMEAEAKLTAGRIRIEMDRERGEQPG